jgi:hemoglobin-like flavoprotein
VARASYERCNADEQFFRDFYRNFFTNCPEVEPMFAKTDFTRQHQLLKHAIGLLLIFPNQSSAEPTILTRVAERHSQRELDVDPAWYPKFVDSLIETARSHDPEFTSETEEAWRQAVAKGVAYMQAQYRRPEPSTG